jgi:hypothetical protein
LTTPVNTNPADATRANSREPSVELPASRVVITRSILAELTPYCQILGESARRNAALNRTSIRRKKELRKAKCGALHGFSADGVGFGWTGFRAHDKMMALKFMFSPGFSILIPIY